jgi:predicted GNAT family acetyltransferase
MPTVLHSPEHSRFEITIGAATAVLEYHLSGKLMTIHHTFVPVELRGRNIAAKLAQAAFQYARTEGLQIVPQCSYIASYTKRFPKEEALVLKD